MSTRTGNHPPENSLENMDRNDFLARITNAPLQAKLRGRIGEQSQTRRLILSENIANSFSLSELYDILNDFPEYTEHVFMTAYIKRVTEFHNLFVNQTNFVGMNTETARNISAQRLYGVMEQYKLPEQKNSLIRALQQLHLNITHENADDYITFLEIWRNIRGNPETPEQSLDTYMYAPDGIQDTAEYINLRSQGFTDIYVLSHLLSHGHLRVDVGTDGKGWGIFDALTGVQRGNTATLSAQINYEDSFLRRMAQDNRHHHDLLTKIDTKRKLLKDILDIVNQPATAESTRKLRTSFVAYGNNDWDLSFRAQLRRETGRLTGIRRVAHQSMSRDSMNTQINTELTRLTALKTTTDSKYDSIIDDHISKLTNIQSNINDTSYELRKAHTEYGNFLRDNPPLTPETLDLMRTQSIIDTAYTDIEKHHNNIKNEAATVEAKIQAEPKKRHFLMRAFEGFTQTANEAIAEIGKKLRSNLGPEHAKNLPLLEQHPGKPPMWKALVSSTRVALRVANSPNVAAEHLRENLSSTPGRTRATRVYNRVATGGLGVVGAVAIALNHEDMTKNDWWDIGIGCIPIAGGIYDIAMACRGKDLEGRDMTWVEIGTRVGFGILGFIPGLGLVSKGIMGGVRVGARNTARVTRAGTRARNLLHDTDKISDAFKDKIVRGIDATQRISQPFATLGTYTAGGFSLYAVGTEAYHHVTS